MFNKWVQLITALCVLVGLLWGGVWAFTEKIALAKDVEQFRLEVVSTFKELRTEMKETAIQQKIDALIIQKYRIREELRKNPNDSIIQEDYRNINKDIKDLKSLQEEMMKRK